MAPRPLVHLELHTGDLSHARSFYTELCGWPEARVGTPARSYLALELGGGIGGGMVECPVRHPLWLPYVEVEDIRETTARARALGARVLLAPCEGPSGWRSVVAAPAAGEIALWQFKR